MFSIALFLVLKDLSKILGGRIHRPTDSRPTDTQKTTKLIIIDIKREGGRWRRLIGQMLVVLER